MGKRILNTEERQLWQRVAQSVRRLKPLREKQEVLSVHSDTGVFRDHQTNKGAATSHSHHPSAPLTPQHTTAKSMQSVLDAGDPRQAQQVRRGKREIDATIDLHGLTQEQAYTALQKFMTLARTKGHRVLLVITGKGTRGTAFETFSESRGILRHRFLQWVEGPFREHIVSVKPSHQRHGGAGAFYVFLKRSSGLK